MRFVRSGKLFCIHSRIAMTTHCASRYQKVLKEIAPRICIVEEAAEVKMTSNSLFKLKKSH